MKELILYLLQSSVCLAVLYGVFWIFLRNDTFFHINRWYLVLTALLSLLIPVFPWRFSGLQDSVSWIVFLDPVIITPGKIESIASRHLQWFEIAGVVYVTGTVLFLLRFIFQVIQILMIARRFGISRRDGMKLVFVDKNFPPFSFFNLVFISKESRQDEKLEAVFIHEKIHARQMHSIDLLIVEFLAIIQWFNPVVWFMNRSLKTIHEYLADEGVLRYGYNKSDYQNLILNEATGIQVNNLTNNFNVSLLKKRLIMMTKTRSKAMAGIKPFMAVPVLFLVLIFFSSGTISDLSAQDNKAPAAKKDNKEMKAPDRKENSEVFMTVEKMPVYPDGQAAMIDYLIKNIKYPEEAKKKGIQGKVLVSFVVEKDGSISEVKVVSGIGSGCDEEAVRVVKGMPKWVPGEQKGKPVRVQFKLPIMFALSADKSKEDKP